MQLYVYWYIQETTMTPFSASYSFNDGAEDEDGAEEEEKAEYEEQLAELEAEEMEEEEEEEEEEDDMEARERMRGALTDQYEEESESVNSLQV